MSPEDIINEFRAKYEKTYVFVKTPDTEEENLFHLDRVTPDTTTTGILHLSSEEYGKIQLNFGTAHGIKFRMPQVGVFQHGKDAYLFNRTPRRQWKRGLCSSNASIFATMNLAAGMARGGEFDFMTVAAAFKAQQYGWPQALKMIQSGKYRSVAIDRYMSIGLSPVTDCPYLLLYWQQPVAKLKADGSVLVILEPSFEASIKELIK